METRGIVSKFAILTQPTMALVSARIKMTTQGLLARMEKAVLMKDLIVLLFARCLETMRITVSARILTLVLERIVRSEIPKNFFRRSVLQMVYIAWMFALLGKK